MRSLWVYKCRHDPDTDANAWGDWSVVFKRPFREHRWGGAWATAKPDGKRIFDEEIEEGDLVLAWQSDKSAVIGRCEVVGRKPSQHGGRDLRLLPVEAFDAPVKLHDLKRGSCPELADVSALKQGHAGTIYRTTVAEAKLLLRACGATTTL